MENQPKHTPGPWKPAGKYATHIIDANGRMIADAPHPNGMTSCEGYANRDIIAAAPDLLAALKTMCSLMANGCGELTRLPFTWREAFDEAESAIAKAEGRGE
jgi:hypothetical protein